MSPQMPFGRGRWALAKGALVALYAAYVARAVGAPPILASVVGVAAMMTAVVFSFTRAARDIFRARSLFAACTLVLAAVHARALPVAMPFQALHMGLAAAVASSSLVTLTLHRSAGRAVVTMVISLATSLIVTLSSGPSTAAFVLGITAALFAWVRPLGALGAALQALGVHEASADPGLFWSAVPTPAHAKQEAGPCR